MPIGYTVAFCLGYLFKKHEAWIINKRTLILVLVSFCISFPTFDRQSSPTSIKIITGTLASIVILNFSKYIEDLYKEKGSWLYRQILAMGQCSIMIYILHFLIVVFTTQIIDTFWITALPLYITLLPLSFVIAYICVFIGRLLSFNDILGKYLFGKI